MGKESVLENKIEELRQKMHELIDKNGSLLHDEVIKASQELDKVINEYNKAIGL